MGSVYESLGSVRKFSYGAFYQFFLVLCVDHKISALVNVRWANMRVNLTALLLRDF